jgi:type IV pilus assembly protein PilQ
MTTHARETKMTGVRRWTGAVVVWCLGALAPAWAQNAIQSVNATQQAGADIVRVELAEPLAQLPQGFTVQTPPRIAIDLPGVGNAVGRQTIDINQGNVRSVTVAQAGDRTRLVLNLKSPAHYRAQLQGKALLLIMDGGASAAAPPAPVDAGTGTQFAPSLNAEAQTIRAIDFRRGPDGSGRVVVDLPSNQVGVDIRQQGRALVVEFLRSQLPDALRRRLDVSDFGTPVRQVATTQVGDRVRMVVEPTGNWEHAAYQTDTQFVLEVRAQQIDPNKLTQGPGYNGEKLSLNFQSIEVRALLQVIADFTNFNVVTSDTVTGNVTLRLKDVPWDQALDIILQAKNLGMRRAGNVILVAPKEELAAKEKGELESRAQIAQLEPLRTQSFQLNYTKSEDLANRLTGQATGGQQGGGGAGGAATRILSPRGSVIAEPRTNQLFVTDIPSKLEEVQALINKVDIPVRQVLIEARIVEAGDSFGRSLGVRLGGSDLRGVRGGVPGVSVGGDTRVAVGGNLNAVAGQTLQTGGAAGVALADTNFVNLPAIGQNDYSAATFALTLFGASANRFLNLELSALEADGKGKVVSSPRVVTADQVEALIEQGEELPYQTATSSGATALQFRKANLSLRVTPQITPEGNVILAVNVNKDSVGRATAAGFAINTNAVRTQVLVENGGTVVIGGIFQQTERDDVTKVPLLGDVPVVGNLFKTRSRRSSKTELLVFLTPKVVTERAAAR